MFEDKTTTELRRLQEKYIDELTKKERTWRSLYYPVGLLAGISGVFLAFRNGISEFYGLLILVGIPAVWMWERDDRLRATVEDLYNQATSELAERRGELSDERMRLAVRQGVSLAHKKALNSLKERAAKLRK
jgi:hypothetical protein